MKIKEIGRTEMNRREKQCTEMIVALCSEIRKHEQALKERLKSHPYGWQMFRAGMSLIEKAEQIIMESMTTRQLVHLREVCRVGNVEITMPKAVCPKNYYPISIKDANVLFGTVVNEHCSMCVEDNEYYKKCPIYNTLMTVYPPLDLTKFGGCPYQNITWLIDEDEQKGVKSV